MIKQKPVIKPGFFQGNRRRLRELSATQAPIVITANGALQSDNYSSFPFRQDSNFWYLTGINDPDIILVMRGKSEYLIVPERSERQIAFDGELDYEAMKAASGVNKIIHANAGWKLLGGQLKRSKEVATLVSAPAYIEELAMYSNPARSCLLAKLRSFNSDLKVVDLRLHLAEMRMIKSSTELEAMQYAIDRTVEMYKIICNNLPRYKNEREIAAFTASYFIENKLGYAYYPIIAGGIRDTTLHYNNNDSVLSGRECLLLDMGAAAGPYYCADITRTYAVNPSKRQQAVYDAVLEVQLFAIDYLKPGIYIKDYETAVNRIMGEKLLELGLITVNDQDSVRQFYPHGTSHFLGLDVHDVGDYTQPLRTGMVLTVEPGIYIKDEAIGIRIEDDVLITPGGNKVLSAALPKRLVSH